jgi:hypothetical protein
VARLMLAAMLVLSPPVAGAGAEALAQPDDWSYRRRDDGLHLRILRDYHLAADAAVDEPIVVVGGSARLDGRAYNDVVVLGGTLRMGPKAFVRGNILTVGGEAILAPGARVAGDIDHVAIVGPHFDVAWARLGTEWWAVAAFGATIVRLGVVFTLALLLTILTPAWVRGISDRAASGMLSAFVGFTGQLLFFPALVALAVALVMSVVGIPLLAALPLLVGAGGLMWAAGFAAVAGRVGRRLRGGASEVGIGDVFTGFVAISTVTLCAHALALGPAWMHPLALSAGILGLTIEYLAWTVGLGAAIAALAGGRPAASRRLPVPMTA